VIALGLPAAAQAGVLSSRNGFIDYTAGPGEANVVSVSFSPTAVTVRDEAGVTSGTGCRPDGSDGRAAACALPASNNVDYSEDAPLSLSLGDRDDRLAIAGRFPGLAFLWVAVSGGSGNDQLAGGTGPEKFDEGADRNGSDTIDGGPGGDSVTYEARRKGVRVSLDGRQDDGQRGEQDNVGRDVENATGGRGSDRLSGNGAENDLEGEEEDEERGGSDRISGRGGNDILGGGAGSNVLLGGQGNDFLEAGEDRRTSRNVLDGGPGEDQLSATGTARSRLIGGGGPDEIEDGDGRDVILARDRSVDDVACGERDVVAADRHDMVSDPSAGGGGRIRHGRLENGCKLNRRGRPAAGPLPPETTGGDGKIEPDTEWAARVGCPVDAGGRCRGRVRISLDGRLLRRARFVIGPDDDEQIFTFRYGKVRPRGSVLTVRVITRDRSGRGRRHVERYHLLPDGERR
jgi:hemolysin type calcium-binding protein